MESINNEEKTLIHISHLHPLKLIASPEQKPMCHACNMLCSNQSYSCTQCNYFLHIICATTKRSIDHPSHPAHTLKLELTPHYGCDGCGVDGSSFCLRCRECSYDLHISCAAIPNKVKHPSHPHPLTLLYNNPYPANTAVSCILCMKNLDVNRWFYLCRSCNFGGHVGCFFLEKKEVLSPGLQASQAPTQLHEEAQLHRQLQEQIIASTITRDANQAALDIFRDNVHYERCWICHMLFSIN